MDFDVFALLQECGVSFEHISTSEMAKTHARWSAAFPDLSDTSREWGDRKCLSGASAWHEYSRLKDIEFFVLPEGHFPSFRCSAQEAPDLRPLADDEYTGCNEVVLVDAHFGWSVVFVNHMTEVGCYFDMRDAQAKPDTMEDA